MISKESFSREPQRKLSPSSQRPNTDGCPWAKFSSKYSLAEATLGTLGTLGCLLASSLLLSACQVNLFQWFSREQLDFPDVPWAQKGRWAEAVCFSLKKRALSISIKWTLFLGPMFWEYWYTGSREKMFCLWKHGNTLWNTGCFESFEGFLGHKRLKRLPQSSPFNSGFLCRAALRTSLVSSDQSAVLLGAI